MCRGMADGQRARREPFRQRQAQRANTFKAKTLKAKTQEVAGAMEEQRLVLDRQAERHADAAADIFLEPGRAGKSLGRMNDLRKTPAARADTGPDLPAACGIFGHRHDDRHTRLAAGRQRSADQARQLRQPPAGAAVAALFDLADINDGLATGQPLGEASPHRQRQPPPIVIGQQRAKTVIIEQ
jgi:hypothetical protein